MNDVWTKEKIKEGFERFKLSKVAGFIAERSFVSRFFVA